MTSRKAVPEGTKRILYLKSRNKCAFPGCDSPLVALPKGESQHKIVGELCHIYSDRENGPRGRVGLVENEYNAYENLIMLCPNHHTIVDGQHEAYSAETLKAWKQKHEAKSYSVSPENLEAPSGVFYHHHFPTALVDQSIEEKVSLLRKSQFLVEYDRTGCALVLSRRLSEGDLCGGSATVKACALAWCARILAGSRKLDKAEECQELAKSLGSDTRIVDAFICSLKGDKNTALKVLADVDSPNARSTAFIVVGHHEGPQGAVAWLKNAGIDVSSLDSGGKFILMRYQHELGQWAAARESAESLSESDIEEVPVLHYMVAMVYLVGTVPLDYRDLVISHVPLNASTYPLASDASSTEIRRTARSHMIRATEVAKKFKCRGVAAKFEEYALWLALRDPEYSDKGMCRLEERLCDIRSALHLVPLGLQYGIPLNLANVEQEIERQAALQGDHSRDAAYARLAIACMQEKPEDIANYFDRHFNTLAVHLDTKAIRFFQIEILAKAGLIGRAEECLELLSEEGLSETEERRFRVVIAKAEGKDTFEDQQKLFNQTGSLTDLKALVKDLGAREDWDDLCEYAEILFAKTHYMQHAEQLVDALHRANRFDRVVELLQANADILEQSTMLGVSYCWALFFEGELLKARSELVKLSADPENANYRALEVNIAIALGDWNSLSAYVANEYQEKEKRSADELIEAAELALHSDSPYAKPLASAAAAKANEDARVLARAYLLAMEAGWEGEPQFLQCLHRALELSVDDGPFLKITLKDVLDMKPEWDRQGSYVRQLLNRGEVPMFFAAQHLGKSLMSLMLFPALANVRESDPRRRVGIPAFSGQHQATQLVTGGTIGLDYTTLLTLSFLNLLGNVVDAFDIVYVPHSALVWLFDERQNASFHQPSWITDARRVLDMLSEGSLEKLSPSTVADRELSSQVGDDLAMLIAEAENVRDEDPHRLVVRPSPVYHVATLGEEEADLTRYAAVVSSCQAVVRKLRQQGEITEIEETNALAYLQLREKPWLHQPEITDNAILYLDDLAVYYFLHAGILEKLIKAKFRLFVSSRLITEFNALCAYERISGEVVEAIENIRSVVSQGIMSKKIKVGKGRNVDTWKEQSIPEHQIADVLALVEDCDAIIADDRFLNQHPYIENDGIRRPLHSTFDLLDALASAGSISPMVRLEHRTSLRRAGYFFVPLSKDELTCHLNTAEVNEGKIHERAHLKAIRESMLFVRMNKWLQLPKEGIWLEMVFDVFVNVLRKSWRAGADISSVEAQSNWISNHIDARDWAHCLGPDSGDETIKSARVKIIFKLTSLASNVPPHLRESYWRWVEDFVLTPIKELEAELYTRIVNLKRRQISELADTDLTEVEQHGE